ncbi:hypothetical protein GXW82_32100 [Streptacidiphilus sp. 4-A2]|nr:hypothetical protein [Streptacidiphilus sp. 4-A2]
MREFQDLVLVFRDEAGTRAKEVLATHGDLTAFAECIDTDMTSLRNINAQVLQEHSTAQIMPLLEQMADCAGRLTQYTAAAAFIPPRSLRPCASP